MKILYWTSASLRGHVLNHTCWYLWLHQSVVSNGILEAFFSYRISLFLLTIVERSICWLEFTPASPQQNSLLKVHLPVVQ